MRYSVFDLNITEIKRVASLKRFHEIIARSTQSTLPKALESLNTKSDLVLKIKT